MNSNTGVPFTIYSDFQTGFDIHPTTGDLAILMNEDAVKRSVRNIVLTNFYERPFQPKFGAAIIASLFENFSPVSEAIFRDNILTAIKNFEPRAVALDVKVTPYIDRNAYAATITFYVQNSQEPITLNIVLDRVR